MNAVFGTGRTCPQGKMASQPGMGKKQQEVHQRWICVLFLIVECREGTSVKCVASIVLKKYAKCLYLSLQEEKLMEDPSTWLGWMTCTRVRSTRSVCKGQNVFVRNSVLSFATCFKNQINFVCCLLQYECSYFTFYFKVHIWMDTHCTQ